METFLKDVSYGIRMLLKNPGVTLVAVITLALGIGANTAIFSGVNAFLLRPLSVPNAADLVRPMEVSENRGPSSEMSYPDFLDYRNQGASFDGMAAEDMIQAALDVENQNDVVWGQVVSANYFDLLGVKPIMGRTFLPDEDKVIGANPLVVVGHSFWQRRMGSDPSAVGKSMQMNNQAYQVIGVAPEHFTGTKYGLALDFWVPMSMAEDLRRSPGLLAERDAHWMNVIGRLKPGVSLQQASAEMTTIAARLNETYPESRARNTKAVVFSEVDGRWGDLVNIFRSAGTIAMVIVGLILLIACANVANLMLARAASRRKEIGIRLALGASRARLVRQLLTESMILSVVGGGLGLLLAFWVTDLMQGFVPILEYNIVDNFFAIDSRALIFTLVVSLATGLVFGLAPAWHSSNPDVVPVLKGDPEAALRGKRRAFGLRNILVVAQVALSLVVLVSGALFIKSFRRAQTMDPGFDNANGLIVSLSPTLVGLDEDQSRSFYRQATERVSHLPGVEAAALVRRLPLGDSSNSNGPILREGETFERGTQGRNILNTIVSPGYFQTMQIPLLEGRDFDDRDQPNNQRVVIINKQMAEMLWPGESAVGKRIIVGVENPALLEVVGVVKTGKYRALAEDPKPFFYWSADQRVPGSMALVVRPSVEPTSLASAIREQLRALDRRVPVFGVKTMAQHKTWALWAPNMASSFSLAFGVLAILLSGVGLYSVMAYVVSQRTREVGIRMALGANRADVMKLITRQGMRLAAVGVVLGLLLSLAVAQVLSSLLIGVSGYDLATFILVPALLVAVTLLACYLPARRATKVDPLVALRYE